VCCQEKEIAVISALNSALSALQADGNKLSITAGNLDPVA
jgi:hypothetical protein